MKKNNLFKAVSIIIIAYVLFSWIAPIAYSGACDGTTGCQIGLTSIFSVLTETFSGFGTTVLFVLLVGAFYGVLKATGAYDKMLNAISVKANGKEKRWLVLTVIFMAFISSISGLDLGLLIVIPFLIGFLTKIGFNKIVSVSATVGAVIIGMYGSIFGGTLYGLNNQVLSLSSYSQILYKSIFFVIGLVGLLVFTIIYCNNNKSAFSKKEIKLDAKKESSSKTIKASKKESKKEDKKVVKKEEMKEKVAKEKVVKDKSERTSLPGFIVFGLVSLIVFLGTTAWANIFSSNIFEKAHSAWTEFTIGGFDIFNKLFGGVDALGSNNWNMPNRFQYYSIILLIAIVVITIIYRKGIKTSFDGFVDGVKDYTIPAILTVVICSVFVFVYYNPVLTSVTGNLLGKDFNVIYTSIYTILDGIFYPDYYYFAFSVLPNISSVYTDNATISVVSVLFTNLYGLVMLVAPTSLILMITLSHTEVNYCEWIKYIWKLALSLLVASLAVFFIMSGQVFTGIILAGIAFVIFGILNDLSLYTKIALSLALIAVGVYYILVSSVLVGIILIGVAFVLFGLLMGYKLFTRIVLSLALIAVGTYLIITKALVVGIILIVVAVILFVLLTFLSKRK